MNDYVRILFELPAEDANWPPTGAETLWAERIGDGQYRVDNIPLFVKGLAFNDVIEAREADGLLEFERVSNRSGHSTYRFIVLGSEESLTQALSSLKDLGCELESARSAFHMFGVDVPPGADVAVVYAFLEELESTGVIAFEEGFFFERDAASS